MTVVVFMILLIALFAQGILFSHSYTEAARAPRTRATSFQDDNTILPGTSDQPTARAIVNFRELAAREAARTVGGVSVPEVIHSPITPPEVETPNVQKPQLVARANVVLPNVPSPGP